jgi:hypothetical protein
MVFSNQCPGNARNVLLWPKDIPVAARRLARGGPKSESPGGL